MLYCILLGDNYEWNRSPQKVNQNQNDTDDLVEKKKDYEISGRLMGADK